MSHKGKDIDIVQIWWIGYCSENAVKIEMLGFS